MVIQEPSGNGILLGQEPLILPKEVVGVGFVLQHAGPDILDDVWRPPEHPAVSVSALNVFEHHLQQLKPTKYPQPPPSVPRSWYATCPAAGRWRRSPCSRRM